MGRGASWAIVFGVAKSRTQLSNYTHTHTHIHLNAEFQRIARRDKKAFLSDQCKVIEENRMGKTRDLFKKIRYQGNMSCKDRHNKEQKRCGPN